MLRQQVPLSWEEARQDPRSGGSIFCNGRASLFFPDCFVYLMVLPVSGNVQRKKDQCSGSLLSSLYQFYISYMYYIFGKRDSCMFWDTHVEIRRHLARESVLSFYSVGPGINLRSSGLATDTINSLSHFSSPKEQSWNQQWS